MTSLSVLVQSAARWAYETITGRPPASRSVPEPEPAPEPPDGPAAPAGEDAP